MIHLDYKGVSLQIFIKQLRIFTRIYIINPPISSILLYQNGLQWKYMINETIFSEFIK